MRTKNEIYKCIGKCWKCEYYISRMSFAPLKPLKSRPQLANPASLVSFMINHERLPDVRHHFSSNQVEDQWYITSSPQLHFLTWILSFISLEHKRNRRLISECHIKAVISDSRGVLQLTEFETAPLFETYCFIYIYLLFETDFTRSFK
jgi:hypothetical protein